MPLSILLAGLGKNTGKAKEGGARAAIKNGARSLRLMNEAEETGLVRRKNNILGEFPKAWTIEMFFFSKGR
jgi:hypothetical protein